MSAIPKPQLNSTPGPAPLTPDVWVASVTAALQTCINLGKAIGPTSVAAVAGVVAKAQSQQLISQPDATPILDFLQTPGASTVVANSAVLATRAFAYITAHTSKPATIATAPAHAATNVAIAAGSSAAAVAPGIESSPALSMTAQQVIAISASTNAVIGKLGRPALPIHGFVRTATPSDSSAGDGGSTTNDGVESDSAGDTVLGVAAGLAVDVVILGTPIGEAIAAEAVAEALVNGVEGLIDLDWDAIPPPTPPDSDGMGSGAQAYPGSIYENGASTPDDSDDGGGGSGSGIDDTRSTKPQ